MWTMVNYGFCDGSWEACADHVNLADPNRQRVLDLKPTLYPIVGVIQEYNLSRSFPRSLLPIALGALNNLLQDYREAIQSDTGTRC